MSAAEATYGHSLVLPSQLQLPPRLPQVPLEKVITPSTVKPAKEAEKVQEVGVQEASHVYVRVGVVTGLLDATYRSMYCVLISCQQCWEAECTDSEFEIQRRGHPDSQRLAHLWAGPRCR